MTEKRTKEMSNDSERYHAIWLDLNGNIVVSTNDENGKRKEVRVAARLTNSDEPIIVTVDGVDEGNEALLRPLPAQPER